MKNKWIWIGIALAIFVVVIFLVLMVNKSISKAVRYTGIGGLDTIFGFFFGLSIFFAQYWGSKDIKNIHKVFIIAAFIGTILTSLFFVLGFFFTDTVISVFNNSGDAENKAILLSYKDCHWYFI